MYFFEQPINVTFGVYDYEIMHYRRSSASISLIGLILAIIANAFTWYSMEQLRYMFKRLAATLHLISAACCWVTVEVFKRSMDYEREHLVSIVPKESDIDFGFSYALTWISMIFFIIVGVALFACSRKRKGRRAHSIKEAQENEPVVLGRV
jgi:cbb3-type cytochrome oxidase subunit 3